MTTGVIYSRRAAAEAEEIKAFLTEHSPSAASRFVQALDAAQQQLAALPQRDRPLDDRPQILALRQRCADLLVLQQGGREVLEHRLAMRGGAAEAAMAHPMAHLPLPRPLTLPSCPALCRHPRVHF